MTEEGTSAETRNKAQEAKALVAGRKGTARTADQAGSACAPITGRCALGPLHRWLQGWVPVTPGAEQDAGWIWKQRGDTRRRRLRNQARRSSENDPRRRRERGQERWRRRRVKTMLLI